MSFEENTLRQSDQEWDIPPHLTHDDPLLQCLVDLVKKLGYPCTPVSYTHLTLPTNREV